MGARFGLLLLNVVCEIGKSLWQHVRKLADLSWEDQSLQALPFDGLVKTV